MKYLSSIAAAFAVAFLVPNFAQAQNQQRPSAEEFRKMREDRIKAALKANDEEWTVLQPMITKIEEKAGALFAFRISSRSFGGDSSGGGRPPGGGSPGGFGRGGTPSPEVTALADAAQHDGVSNEEFKAKIEAARAARKRAQAELDSARAELQKVVTVRQEAVLLAMGVLE